MRKPRRAPEVEGLPDVRDGLTRLERVVLVTLQTLQRERGGRGVSSAELYGRVVEVLDVSEADFTLAVQRLAQVPGKTR